MSQAAQVILDRPDRPYAIRWTARAVARNSSLARPVAFADLAHRKRGSYALVAILWASLVEKDHSFDAPEDLADFLKTDEQQTAALKAISAMVREAFPEKKSPPSAEPSPTGPSPSSSADSPPGSTPGS